MRAPWRDRHGRLLPLKAVVFPAVFLPGLAYGFWWIDGDLSARALNDVIHATGNWAVRFTLMSLTVTPFARIFEWPKLLIVRRMVGLTALAYGIVHLSLYIVSQKFNLLTVGSEIAMRFYLTIGFIALAGMAALGITSTDAAMKRMGRNWKKLHRLAYPIGALAILHFFIQTKANVAEPVLVSGFFAWLMVWRGLPQSQTARLLTFWWMVPASGLITAGLEFAWYGLATQRDPFHILTANWNERYFPRPAHEVAVVALAVAIGITARRWQLRRRTAPPSSVSRAIAR